MLHGAVRLYHPEGWTRSDSHPCISFYALRHTFETIAGESRDQVAVNAGMGHVDTTMAAAYRERVLEVRLKAVVETVRAWLFGDDKDTPNERVQHKAKLEQAEQPQSDDETGVRKGPAC